jgi:hypothetical protein
VGETTGSAGPPGWRCGLRENRRDCAALLAASLAQISITTCVRQSQTHRYQSLDTARLHRHIACTRAPCRHTRKGSQYGDGRLARLDWRAPRACASCISRRPTLGVALWCAASWAGQPAPHGAAERRGRLEIWQSANGVTGCLRPRRGWQRPAGCIARGLQAAGLRLPGLEIVDRSPSAVRTSSLPQPSHPDAIIPLHRPIACETGHGIASRAWYYSTRLCFAPRRVSPDPAISTPWRPQPAPSRPR